MKFMNILERSDREVFILRVWKSHEKDAPLRGHIQHVRSGESFPLRKPENVLLVIQEQVETAKEKTPPSGIR